MQCLLKFVIRQKRILYSKVFEEPHRSIGIFKHTFQYEAWKTNCIYLQEDRCFTQNVSITSTVKRSRISNINDLKQYISDKKQFYIKLLTNILDTIEFASIASEDARLLLECCGSSVADSSQQTRNDVCQKIYKELFQHNKLDLTIYHAYIKICTENNILLDSIQFLTSLKCEPDQNTYKLLLDNVCEKGNVDQAYKLLKIMKTKNIPADEEVFNKLVLVYTIHDGLKGGESVLMTMRTAQVSETTNTKFSILKGVAKRNNMEDFENVLVKYKIELTESHLLKLLEILALNGNISWLPKIRNLYPNIVISREFLNALEKLCIHLVHMGESDSAITIYKEFVKPVPEKNYGFFILKEMLHCNIDIDTIVSVAKHLRDENFNQFALENLTELALKHEYTEAAWKLLENLYELRAHFFWPLLINANEKEGEAGVLDVLKKIINMNVKIDSETLQYYILPFCDLDNFKYILKKLQDLGMGVKEVLSPMLIVLLQNNKLKHAADLCSPYNVQIFGGSFLNLLSTNWKTTNDTESVVLLLQRYCESNPEGGDWVGDFLIKTLNNSKTDAEFINFLKLIKYIYEKKLRIHGTSADILHTIIRSATCPSDIAEKIRNEIDHLLDFTLKTETAQIPHPRNMKIDELECHLLELKEKMMETRGVLRKLIQLHSNLGNIQRVYELRQQFLDAGYEESAGMKSSLMHSYVKGGHLEAALNMYKEIKNSYPNFKLDDFKIIDLTILFIKENKFNEGMDILQTETKNRDTMNKTKTITGVQRNCWQLLRSFKNSEEQFQMFKFLIENGYCEPTNVILGPLVGIHLKRGDLQKAANVYIDCTKKYKHTPLQLEIICSILKVEDEVLLQTVLKATQNIHGAIQTQQALIAALAENRQEKPLTKLFANNKVNCKKELEKRCERWIQEGKVEALQTLANAGRRLPKEVFDINFVYNCIMRIYDLNNNYKEATKFYEKLLEADEAISKDLEKQFNKLLKKIK